MFIVILTYTCSLEAVDEALEAHIAYLKEQYRQGHFIVSGRRVPRTGGIILAKVKNRKELELILEKDPFKVSQLATYEIIEFVPSMTADAFKHFLEP